MTKIDIAGLKVDALTKQELLAQIEKNITNGKQTWVTTLYSEFLHAALRDPSVMQLLNQADIAVPDGIGMFWAKKFLDLPLTAKSYIGKIAQAYWQAFYTLCAILIRPSYVRSVLPEKISGADLIWDLAKFTADKNLSAYLLGGFGDTPKLAAEKLLSSFFRGHEKMTRLKIAGWLNKDPEDPTVIEDIKKAAPDLLFVAYGPIKQERWIAGNLPNLPVKLAIGLGGTFDYLAGKVPNPPRFLRQIGLEWLYRLLTQPHRFFRIFNATFGLIDVLVHYKVFHALPLRPNVAIAILNKQNQVLVCEREPENFHINIITTVEALKRRNYWQLPQGGIDGNENVIDAAKREAFEETSLKNLEFIKLSDKTNTYIWNNALRRFTKNKKFQNKGQVQHIAYFRFTGPDDEIKVDNIEFINCKWVAPYELDKTIHPDRLQLTKIVQDDLKEMQEKGII